MSESRHSEGVSPETIDQAVEEGNRPVIQVEGLSKNYGSVQALRDVDLEVQDGEIFAIIGDNGAGKSTLIKILSGVTTPSSGRIRIRDNGTFAENVDAIDHLETVFQDLQLSEKHDIASNVFMGQEPHMGGLRGVFGQIDRQQMERQTTQTLAEIGFDMDPNAVVGELSGGQQQAVAVARALVSDPKIVLLDEPTAEVSVEGSEKILDLMVELNNQGQTMVFITHNLPEVFRIADRVAVFRDGEVVTVLDVTDDLEHHHLVSLMTGADLDDIDYDQE